MRECITVLAVVVLLTPCLFTGGHWRVRNLRGIFRLFDHKSPNVLWPWPWPWPVLGQARSRAVRACVQRISARVVKRLVRTLSKFVV
jgi:hypothetical protein